MLKRTALYPEHQALGALCVDFAGWEMPLHYGSQLQEHHYVRQSAGMFDVSHMLAIDLHGDEVTEFLCFLLANDVAKLKTYGKALYSCLLNEKGGILDDLIVYFVDKNFYRLVVNAGTAESDLEWIKKQAQNYAVKIEPRRDLAILAVQGPEAISHTVACFTGANEKEKIKQLATFEATVVGDCFVAKTGYTGEEGVEILLPHDKIVALWQKLLARGVHPCGLGARDTLRLEAGLNLYGADMDASVTPLESNLAWTVAFEPNDRDFIGRTALEAQRGKLKQQLVGLVLETKGVLRNHQVVYINDMMGEITSGSFSPTLGCSIALARVPVISQKNCDVDVRGKRLPARIVKPPFVRNGQSKI